MRLILASSSPRRRELLCSAGLDFDVRPSSVPEVRLEGELPERFAQRVAREKALQVGAASPAGSFVLGADTVVVAGDQMLEKPENAADAARMLRVLSGRAHRVMTAVCLVESPALVRAERIETTWVYFRALDDGEISEYVAGGEPADKAGAYGIQGLASKFVIRIEGCYFNVVGLPVALVVQLLKQHGVLTQ